VFGSGGWEWIWGPGIAAAPKSILGILKPDAGIAKVGFYVMVYEIINSKNRKTYGANNNF
jgi:hypothetical protein